MSALESSDRVQEASYVVGRNTLASRLHLTAEAPQMRQQKRNRAASREMEGQPSPTCSFSAPFLPSK